MDCVWIAHGMPSVGLESTLLYWRTSYSPAHRLRLVRSIFLRVESCRFIKKAAIFHDRIWVSLCGTSVLCGLCVDFLKKLLSIERLLDGAWSTNIKLEFWTFAVCSLTIRMTILFHIGCGGTEAGWDNSSYFSRASGWNSESDHILLARSLFTCIIFQSNSQSIHFPPDPNKEALYFRGLKGQPPHWETSMELCRFSWWLSLVLNIFYKGWK